MTADMQKVKDRIRQLLNVAANDAATDGEIDNALRIAQGEMARHHLSETDLVTEPAEQWADIDSAEKGEARAIVGSKKYYWECLLAQFCQQFVGGVKIYASNSTDNIDRIAGSRIVRWDDNGEIRKGKAFVFYGVAEDAELAKDLFDELRATIITMARLTWGGAFKGDGGTYCEGFVAGLNTKLKKAEARQRLESQGNSTGMILVERRADLIKRKQQAAELYLREKGVKLGSGGRMGGSNGSEQAYNEGKADGQASDVGVNRTKKIGD